MRVPRAKTRNSKMLKQIFITILLVYFSSSRIVMPGNKGNLLNPAEGGDFTKENFTSGQLIFEETFDKFRTDVWTREPNNNANIKEFQLYTNSIENSFVKNGMLHIKPTLARKILLNENMKNHKGLRNNFHPVHSARVNTNKSFSFTYGTVEFRAKTPSGDWLFPALWLMPRGRDYGDWPASGEIDVMESRGNRNLKDGEGNLVGAQLMGSTLHWGPSKNIDPWKLTHFEAKNDECFSSDFHIYKLVWTKDTLSFFVDGKKIGTVTPPSGGFWEMGNFKKNHSTYNPWTKKYATKEAPFDRQFYLIINLAVGGTAFFSDSYINKGGKPWNNTSPTASREFWEGRKQWLPTWNTESDDSHFVIDYVRVWAL